MRIAQAVESLEVGGLERMALDLALGFRNAGDEVSFCCVLRRGELADEALAHGFPVSVFDKQPGLSPDLPLRLAGHFRRHRVEVVHSHNPGIHHYVASAARLAGVRVVVNTRHGPLMSSGKPYNERLFQFSLPFTDEVVFVSEQSRRVFLAQTGVPERLTSVIVNGIRLEPYRRQAAAPGSARPLIRFGAVGRLVPAKSHTTLIDAFALLHSRLPAATLRIAGDGPLRPDLQARVARAGLQSCITLAGHTADVPGFLRDLDIFVFSSKNEGLPMAILEAMAAGLPIVSTRVGGVPEVVPEGDVGWFCPIEDPAALADAMYAAAVSPDLERRGRRAIEHALARYSIEAMHAAYASLYRKYLV